MQDEIHEKTRENAEVTARLVNLERERYEKSHIYNELKLKVERLNEENERHEKIYKTRNKELTNRLEKFERAIFKEQRSIAKTNKLIEEAEAEAKSTTEGSISEAKALPTIELEEKDTSELDGLKAKKDLLLEQKKSLELTIEASSKKNKEAVAELIRKVQSARERRQTLARSVSCYNCLKPKFEIFLNLAKISKTSA